MRERPAEFLDRRTIEEEGLDAAARDFLAGMTDRYAVSLYEQLFIPEVLGSVGRSRDSGLGIRDNCRRLLPAAQLSRQSTVRSRSR